MFSPPKLSTLKSLPLRTLIIKTSSLLRPLHFWFQTATCNKIEFCF